MLLKILAGNAAFAGLYLLWRELAQQYAKDATSLFMSGAVLIYAGMICGVFLGVWLVAKPKRTQKRIVASRAISNDVFDNITE